MRARFPRPDLFYVALPLCALVAVLGLVSPTLLEAWARYLVSTAFRGLDWFFLATTSGFVLLSLWLGFGRYGSVKLGRGNDEPEFSTASWLSMLFAAGMGVGLLFWGVAEPVNHFSAPPLGEGGTGEAARRATVYTLFHWGLHAWGVYCLSGLVLAYFGFRFGAPHLAGTPIRHIFRGRWVGPVAWMADLVAVLAVAFGVAGSTGTGVMQLQAGLHAVAGVPLHSAAWAFAILGVLVVTYLSSAITGLDKGIKWLSNLNMLVAVALVLFLLVVGPTAFLLRGLFTAVGDYLSSLVTLSLQLFPYEKPGEWPSQWLETWTLTNFVWWIAWAPFVGVFIARVSKGRTIREFVLGVLFVPAVFSLLWFVVFGGTAIHEELYGAGGMERLVREDVTAALFALFDRLPAPTLLGVTAVLLAFIFLVTSLNSATFVLGMLTSGGSPDPSIRRQLAWGFGLGALGAALLLSGNVHALRAVSISGAIPFILILLLQVVALVRGLAIEFPRRGLPESGPPDGSAIPEEGA
ncbi:BCCT family transporter [Thiohalorhabdus sp. Cl-TMA]|uniref:BCCT family transporter n=1 Tax=Thiohalorhabdus methylotrophus TaxID=3242694 RepID=A0ABV4TTC0_9GAMM